MLQVAKNLSGFELKRVIYTSRHEVEHPYAQKVEFEQLLGLSDFLIICCELNESTRGMFNKDTLQKMKSSAILINTSRGPLVNMDDLSEALSQGVIAGAGLDVTVPEPIPLDHKLLSLHNCVILPHIGSATIEARSAMSELTARNIIAGLRAEPMPAEL